MQQKSENYLEFSERTEALSQKLGVKLSDLPPVIGISPAMFYAHRTGKHHISDKTWRKLESAEVTAGVMTKKTQPVSAPRVPPPEAGRHMGPSDFARGRPPVSILPSADYAFPPPPITREQIESRVSAYLDAAERVPGGLGFAWGQVCLHLDIAHLSALDVPPPDKKF